MSASPARVLVLLRLRKDAEARPGDRVSQPSRWSWLGRQGTTIHDGRRGGGSGSTGAGGRAATVVHVQEGGRVGGELVRRVPGGPGRSTARHSGCCRLPACMHYFHDACVNEWLRKTVFRELFFTKTVGASLTSVEVLRNTEKRGVYLANFTS